jgi:hypothetical protein
LRYRNDIQFLVSALVGSVEWANMTHFWNLLIPLSVLLESSTSTGLDPPTQRDRKMEKERRERLTYRQLRSSLCIT